MIEVKKTPPLPVINVHPPEVRVSPAPITVSAPKIEIPPAQVQVLPRENCPWRFDVHRDNAGRISHITATPQ